MYKTLMKVHIILIISLLAFPLHEMSSQDHPKLVLTKRGVSQIKAQLGNVPVFDLSLQQAIREVDA